MTLLRPILRLGTWLRENAGLLALWWVLLVVAPLVPPDNLLSRPDLVPWATLTLCLGLLLRGSALAEGPHPYLVPRRARGYALVRRVALVLVPAVLFGCYEAARTWSVWPLALAFAGAVVAAGARAFGAEHGRTAWSPPGWPAGVIEALVAVATAAAAGLGGLLTRQGVEGLAKDTGFAVFLGVAFLGAGIFEGRVIHARQRRRAGLKDGRPFRPSLFKPALAVIGPGLGLWLLYHLEEARFGPMGFEQAFTVALHVVVWVAILCPRAPAAAVQCVLHEVVPTGGADAQTEESATSFELPPDGSLRLEPLKLRRTRAAHLWLVAVQDARISAYDDPIRPLWSRPPPPLAAHVMGEARFEPDPVTLENKADTVTVRLRGHLDVSQLGAGDAQTRRVAVLRPWPQEPWWSRRQPRTYRWEPALPVHAVQVVDATTEALSLRDGDIIVLSTEGVARAFELEIGATVPASSDLLTWRIPQIEDYAKA